MIVKKGNDKLKNEINKVLERLIKEGTIDKLILKYCVYFTTNTKFMVFCFN